MTLLFCLVVAPVLAAAVVVMLDSDGARFGAEFSATCASCGQLRRCRSWHDAKPRCAPCRAAIEGAMP